MIQIHDIPYGTKEWHAFRERGIGGSEIASVLGWDLFRSAYELFHQKLGVSFSRQVTEFMVMGRVEESNVAELWTYWDGSQWMTNYPNEPQRTCRIQEGYVTNSAYPQLFFSPDRIIDAGQMQYRRGNHAIGGEGYLECKNIGADMHRAHPLPTGYMFQVMQGMMVMNMDYGELALKIGGQRLKVIHLEASAKTFDLINARSAEFMDRVSQARALIIKDGLTGYGPDLIRRHVDHLAPAVSEQEKRSYATYCGEFLPYGPELLKGSDAQYIKAKKLAEMQAKYRILGIEIKAEKADLIRDLNTQGCNGLQFGYAGKITYNPNKNGVYTFRNTLNDD